MPRATAKRETVRCDLKSCEGGFVVLRKLTYGEAMDRDGLAAKMRAAGRTQTNGEGPAGAEVTMQVTAVQVFEFSRCIVEHNLTDDNDRTLDLTSEKDIKSMDMNVGREIESLIDHLNAGDDMTPFLSPSTKPSEAKVSSIQKSPGTSS